MNYKIYHTVGIFYYADERSYVEVVFASRSDLGVLGTGAWLSDVHGISQIGWYNQAGMVSQPTLAFLHPTLRPDEERLMLRFSRINEAEYLSRAMQIGNGEFSLRPAVPLPVNEPQLAEEPPPTPKRRLDLNICE